MRYSAQRGVTRLEWLVMALVTTVCLGLGISSVYSAQADARRVRCTNNMRNVALAMMQYDTAKQMLPGWAHVLCGDPETGTEDPPRSKVASWAFELLPYIEKGDLYYLYGPHNTDTSAKSLRCMGQGSPQDRVTLLRCPNDEVAQKSDSSLSYVVNCGLRDRGWNQTTIGGEDDIGGQYREKYQEPPANGMIHNRYYRVKPDGYKYPGYTQNSLAFASANDGTANTLLVSENLDATFWPGGSAADKLDVSEGTLCFCWSGAEPKAAAGDPKNGLKINFQAGKHAGRAPRPSSGHQGGVNVIFCDGHSAFIPDDIDWMTWCLLLTPHGKEVMAPGKDGPKQNAALRPFQQTELKQKF